VRPLCPVGALLSAADRRAAARRRMHLRVLPLCVCTDAHDRTRAERRRRARNRVNPLVRTRPDGSRRGDRHAPTSAHPESARRDIASLRRRLACEFAHEEEHRRRPWVHDRFSRMRSSSRGRPGDRVRRQAVARRRSDRRSLLSAAGRCACDCLATNAIAGSTRTGANATSKSIVCLATSSRASNRRWRRPHGWLLMRIRSLGPNASRT